jgi:hypothetical protein
MKQIQINTFKRVKKICIINYDINTVKKDFKIEKFHPKNAKKTNCYTVIYLKSPLKYN